MKITEKIIGKANLSSEEAKVARVFYGLPTAGKKTRNWVEGLKKTKRDNLFLIAQEKIKKILQTEK